MDIPAVLRKNQWIAVLLFFALLITILDLYTTYLLHMLGYIEANPFMNYLLTNFGLWFFITVNFVQSMLILSFLTWGSVEKLEGKFSCLPLMIYCIIRGAAVVNNMRILHMH